MVKDVLADSRTMAAGDAVTGFAAACQLATHTQDRRTVTVEQAARQLGIGRGHAYELARRGELPGVIRLGRRFVVSRAALDRALAGDAHDPSHDSQPQRAA